MPSIGTGHSRPWLKGVLLNGGPLLAQHNVTQELSRNRDKHLHLVAVRSADFLDCPPRHQVFAGLPVNSSGPSP